jgi:hypothetical protein
LHCSSLSINQDLVLLISKDREIFGCNKIFLHSRPKKKVSGQPEPLYPFDMLHFFEKSRYNREWRPKSYFTMLHGLQLVLSVLVPL